MRSLFALLVSASAWGASAPTLGGNLFGDFYVSTISATQASPQVSTIGWLNIGAKLDERSAGLLQLEGRVIESSLSQGRPTPTGGVSVREGYLTYSTGGLDLAVGKQILVWGKSDLVSPTDFLSGKDYGLLNPDDEVRRQGATAIRFDYTFAREASSVTASAVVVPVPALSTILLPRELLPAGALVAPLEYPRATLANAEAALRVAYFGSGWDVALVGFHGWQKLPEYAPRIDFAAKTVTLVPTPHKIDALGLNGSFATGKWTFRAESAYVWTQNRDGDFGLIQPSYLETVIGAEVVPAEGWRVTVQLIDKYIPYYRGIDDGTGLAGTALAEFQVASLNAVLLGYHERRRDGVSARVAYRPDKASWEAELFAMAYHPAGFLVRPKASFDLTDTLKLTAGAEAYGGPRDSQLGALNPYSAVFFEGKYSF